MKLNLKQEDFKFILIGFIPTLFVIIVFAIKSPFLSTILDLNSDMIKFLFDIFFIVNVDKITFSSSFE